MKMAYRYYSTLRPIAPGTFPGGKKVVEIHNFDKRTAIEGIKTGKCLKMFFGTISADTAKVYTTLLPLCGKMCVGGMRA